MKWMIGLVGALALAAAPVHAVEWGQFGMTSLRIAVKDEAKSIAFYKHFGMKVGRLHHPGQQEMDWDSPSQGPGIVLISSPSKLAPGTNNFLITVPDTVALLKDLKSAGFEVPEPSTTPNYVGADVKDPDGNVLHVMGPLPKK